MKFKKEFIHALKVNRVRAEKQVAKLRECLSGGPKERCNDLQVYPHLRNVRGICQTIAHHIVVFKPLCCSDCQSDLGWQLQDTGTG